MRHIITSIFINTTDKDKKPYKTREGKPFKRVVIKVDVNGTNPKEYDGESLSNCIFHDDDPCLLWKTGDEINILVEKKGDFWNFRQPSKYDLLEKRVEVLEAFMGNGGEPSKIDAFDFKESNPSELPDIKDNTYPENPDNIPF